MRKVNQKHLTVYIVVIYLALPLSFVAGGIHGLVFGGMFGGRWFSCMHRATSK
jgi:hypothetical protein